MSNHPPLSVAAAAGPTLLMHEESQRWSLEAKDASGNDDEKELTALQAAVRRHIFGAGSSEQRDLCTLSTFGYVYTFETKRGGATRPKAPPPLSRGLLTPRTAPTEEARRIRKRLLRLVGCLYTPKSIHSREGGGGATHPKASPLFSRASLYPETHPFS